MSLASTTIQGIKKVLPKTTKTQSLTIALVFVTLMLFGFVAHAYMQHFYYLHCKANVFRVMLLNKSTMCITLHSSLEFIESTYASTVHIVVKNLFLPVFAMLGHVVPIGTAPPMLINSFFV